MNAFLIHMVGTKHLGTTLTPSLTKTEQNPRKKLKLIQRKLALGVVVINHKRFCTSCVYKLEP